MPFCELSHALAHKGSAPWAKPALLNFGEKISDLLTHALVPVFGVADGLDVHRIGATADFDHRRVVKVL